MIPFTPAPPGVSMRWNATGRRCDPISEVEVGAPHNPATLWVDSRGGYWWHLPHGCLGQPSRWIGPHGLGDDDSHAALDVAFAAIDQIAEQALSPA